MRETQVQSLGWEDLLEKEMATHSSTLACKILWTEEPSRLQSMGSEESDTIERPHFHFLPFLTVAVIHGIYLPISGTIKLFTR